MENHTTRNQEIIAGYMSGTQVKELAVMYGLGERQIQTIISENTGGIKRVKDSWLVISDLHLPYIDVKCMESIINYAKEERIENLMVLGDAFDFHEISAWGDKFRKPLEDEIDESIELLHQTILSKMTFKQKKFVKGNHEDRLNRYLINNARKIQGLLEKRGFDVPSLTGMDKAGFDYIDNVKLRHETGKYFKIGHLNFLHGHEIKNGGKYPARNLIMKCHDNVIVGHNHRPDVAYEFDLDGTPRSVNSIGCCCEMYPEYMTFNEWRHGFGIVRFRESGLHTTENKIIVNGDVY